MSNVCCTVLENVGFGFELFFAILILADQKETNHYEQPASHNTTFNKAAIFAHFANVLSSVGKLYMVMGLLSGKISQDDSKQLFPFLKKGFSFYSYFSRFRVY